MIKFIDFLSYSSSHVSFNSCVVNNCDNFDVSIVGECRHVENIISLTNKNIKTIKYKKRTFWKVKRDFLFIKEVFFNGADNHVNIFILGATGTQLLLLSLFLYVFRAKRSDIRLVFHSELEFFDGKKGINKFCAKIAVKYLNLTKLIPTAVLSRHIKSNMLNISSKYSDVSVVRHPMPSFNSENFMSNDSRANGDLKLAIIGLLRGDTKDLSLPSKLREIDGVSVRAFGRKGPFVEKLELTNKCRIVDSHYSDEWLSDCMSSIDSLLLIPKINSYKFTALGTVSDSISLGKPLVWKHHPALTDFESLPLATVFNHENTAKDILLFHKKLNLDSVYRWVNDWNDKSKNELSCFIHGGIK